MLEIHNKGGAVCGVYPYDVARAKVTEVLDFAGLARVASDRGRNTLRYNAFLLRERHGARHNSRLEF
jgi:hypothetical protein